MVALSIFWGVNGGLQQVGVKTMTINKTVYEHTLREGIRVFQDAINHKDVPLHTIDIFLAISEKSPPTIEDVAKMFPQLTQSSISRNVQILSGESKTRKDGGFGLCQTLPDPADRRYKRIHLTEFGKAVRDRMFLHGARLINESLSS